MPNGIPRPLLRRIKKKLMKLKVIIASTRPGRKGPIIADWFVDHARNNADFDVEVLDLKKINLPFLDEPMHPKAGDYRKDHTKAWSRKIEEADAFVVITPEYNFGYPAALKNALDYLHHEWYGKAMGFVSYGGVSGGTRAVQEIKSPVTTLGMMPLTQAVNIPFFWEFINEDGELQPNEITVGAADMMLKKLAEWAEALKGMREKNLVGA